MERDAVTENPTPYREALALAERAIASKSPEDLAAYAEALARVAKDLAARYPDHQLRKIWHALARSTPGPEATVDDDFPGKDAVLPFLREIA